MKAARRRPDIVNEWLGRLANEPLAVNLLHDLLTVLAKPGGESPEQCHLPEWLGGMSLVIPPRAVVREPVPRGPICDCGSGKDC